MPSEEWKNGVGSALTTYAADQTDDNWAAVVSAFIDGWAKEAAASNNQERKRFLYRNCRLKDSGRASLARPLVFMRGRICQAYLDSLLSTRGGLILWKRPLNVIFQYSFYRLYGIYHRFYRTVYYGCWTVLL